ncbi:hydroxyacylglutathione hydrolase [Cellvibrio sp. OA-2007]|uniref:hydroxyacylglutathione hydrolase n=1 Tax=Cellvibrio sp. OA-2007 TaxID=529823 RepID=UPI000780C5AD|nr:hydroxyacylglutathione hydrolase [Cellvibrio sp. OA-2007]
MLTITPIPALDSNYFWVIRPDLSSPSVYVVDPGDAAPVMDFLIRSQLELSAILVTHRHRDHTQGITTLLEHWQVPVYGPDSELIPQITHILNNNDVLQLDGITFRVIAVPGHTWEHIVYFCDSTSNHPPLLFCGDALFAGGCGRRFDGTAEIMWDSLQKLAALPDDTQIYCAHEYTQANLAFAVAVEPDNIELCARFERVQHARAQGLITLPSTMLLEKRTNPFLRCQQSGIRIFAEDRLKQLLRTPAEIFGALRLIKDNWPN